MARTAHHFPRSRSTSPYDSPPGSDALRSAVLYDLRYSAASVADAAREGRRPRPEKVRRRVAVHCFPRYNRDRSVARWAAEEERRARQRLRRQVGIIRGLLNDGSGELDPEMGEVVEVVPALHRHGAIWLA